MGEPGVIRVVGILAALVVLAVSAQSAPAAPPAQFSITVDGYEIASFAEIDGLPGATPETITLERGSGGAELASWARSGALRNATLEMHAADDTEVARWNFEAAWPSKVEISGLKAGASEVLYETVTLHYAQIEG
jgi:hypothetical protein